MASTPIAGRTFSADDEAKRADVVVMSEGVLAHAIQLRSDRHRPRDPPRRIAVDASIGVVPQDFQLLGQTSIWAMRPLVNLPPQARGAYMLQVVGRMKPGVSIKAAEADLECRRGWPRARIPADQQGPRRERSRRCTIR